MEQGERDAHNRLCGSCGDKVTDPQERAAGYHEPCAEQVGWPYPTRTEALALLGEPDDEQVA